MPVAFETFRFDSFDGTSIFVKHWPAAEKRAVIQLAHGLGETSDYYDEFCRAAAPRGFEVYIPEARGHGRTAGKAGTPEYRLCAGHMGRDGIHKTAEDHHILTGLIKKATPEAPVFLMGHSMGAIVAQLYAEKYGGLLRGLVLTGLPSPKGAERILKILDEEIAEKGLRAPCEKAFGAMFAEIVKPFEPMKTELDWVTSDEEMIRDSLAMPYTGVFFDNEFYRDFLLAILKVYHAVRVPPALPVLLAVGGDDAMTDRKTVGALAEMYLANGTADIEVKVYDGLRHSILREKERAKVAADLLGWIQRHLG